MKSCDVWSNVTLFRYLFYNQKLCLWHSCKFIRKAAVTNGSTGTFIYELILKGCYHHYEYLQIQKELQNDKADVTVNFRKPSGKHPVWIGYKYKEFVTRLFVVLFRLVRKLKIYNSCPLESRSLLIFPFRLPVHLYVRRVTGELPYSEKARNVFAEWRVVKFVMVAKHWGSFQAETFLSTTVLHRAWSSASLSISRALSFP